MSRDGFNFFFWMNLDLAARHRSLARRRGLESVSKMSASRSLGFGLLVNLPNPAASTPSIATTRIEPRPPPPGGLPASARWGGVTSSSPTTSNSQLDQSSSSRQQHAQFIRRAIQQQQQPPSAPSSSSQEATPSPHTTMLPSFSSKYERAVDLVTQMIQVAALSK